MKFPGVPPILRDVSSPESRRAACREQALRCVDRLPPFSPILNRLLASLAQEDVSFGELAELIEKDTVLAGNVLRLVNSALYGFQGTVNSVRHAVAILGIVKLRNTLLSFSVSRMWRNVAAPPGWSMAAFDLHSVATAILADFLVEMVPAPYPEGAFVAGLLHDLGKLLIATGLPKEHLEIRELFNARGRSMEECESSVMGATHAELSGAALEKWNLPKPIQEAVRFHHCPDEADSGQLHLSHVIRAANLIAADLGHALPPVRPDRNDAASEAAEALGVSDRLPWLMAQFEPEFELIRAFF